jgi:hypothetical protein
LLLARVVRFVRCFVDVLLLVSSKKCCPTHHVIVNKPRSVFDWDQM